MSGIPLALSHQRVAVKRRGRRRWSRPPAGEAGRAQREPWPASPGPASACKGPIARQRQVGAAPLPHFADML